MSVETDEFVLDRMEWSRHPDLTLGDGRVLAAVKGALRYAYVTCKGCRHQWHWRQDNSDPPRGIGGPITLTCPKCPVTKDISPTLFG